MSMQVMEAGGSKVGGLLDYSKFIYWQRQSVQISCGAHPVSYSMGTGVLYKGVRHVKRPPLSSVEH
jgi:hypothetical protein